MSISSCSIRTLKVLQHNVGAGGLATFDVEYVLQNVHYSHTFYNWAGRVTDIRAELEALLGGNISNLTKLSITGGDIAGSTERHTYIFGKGNRPLSNLIEMSLADVTAIQEGALSGASKLVTLVIPFSGAKSGTATTDNNQYPFGYIFGRDAYTGGVSTLQYYNESAGVITSKTYYIPSTLRSVTITNNEVLPYAFYNCSRLTNIIIPNITQTINYQTFYNCSGLANFTIPDGVTSIDVGAFHGCSSLKNITVPNSVVAIGGSAFSGCGKLESITLPFVGGSESEVSTSPSTLFGYIFGTSSYSGGVQARQYYNSTQSVTYYIPKTLVNVTLTSGDILPYAFNHCGHIASVAFASDITSIGANAFDYCSGLSNNLFIPNTVTNIGACAFRACGQLTTVDFPNNTLTVGSEAFTSCTGLRYVTIPQSARVAMARRVFANCSALVDITIDGSIISVGQDAFAGCTGLLTIRIQNLEMWCNIVFEDYTANPLQRAQRLYLNGSLISNLVIPDGVVELKSYVFYQYRNLTNASLPSSVNTIGDQVFAGCINLAGMQYGGTTTEWPSVVRGSNWHSGLPFSKIFCEGDQAYISLDA